MTLTSELGENEDFIAGVDNLPPRNVIDFQTNQYCDGFLDFLVSINMCVLNGRNSKQNDFTSISVKGTSSVNYCLVPYESLERFDEFEVIRS